MGAEGSGAAVGSGFFCCKGVREAPAPPARASLVGMVAGMGMDGGTCSGLSAFFSMSGSRRPSRAAARVPADHQPGPNWPGDRTGSCRARSVGKG
jgi:hypothetical protein